jgi:hypothetical protein
MNATARPRVVPPRKVVFLMRAEGVVFPNYELTDHTGKLSDLQGPIR